MEISFIKFSVNCKVGLLHSYPILTVSPFFSFAQHLPRESASGLLLQPRGPPTSVSAAIAAAQASQAANDASH